MSTETPPQGTLCPAIADNHKTSIHPLDSHRTGGTQYPIQFPWATRRVLDHTVPTHRSQPDPSANRNYNEESLTPLLWHLLSLQTHLQLFSALFRLPPAVASWHQSVKANTGWAHAPVLPRDFSCLSFTLPNCSSTSYQPWSKPLNPITALDTCRCRAHRHSLTVNLAILG